MDLFGIDTLKRISYRMYRIIDSYTTVYVFILFHYIIVPTDKRRCFREILHGNL